MFNSQSFAERPGDVVSSNRYRQVEMAINFRKLTCYRCRFTGIYRYRVQQVRRNLELQPESPEERSLWETIPRFAEIPETVKCRRCKEVLGVYTNCIY